MTDLNKQETAKAEAEAMETRDGELYRVIGFFIGVVGLPVVIGTYWAYAEKGKHAAIVNAVCGLVLLGVGAASILYGQFILNRQKRRQ